MKFGILRSFEAIRGLNDFSFNEVKIAELEKEIISLKTESQDDLNGTDFLRSDNLLDKINEYPENLRLVSMEEIYSQSTDKCYLEQFHFIISGAFKDGLILCRELENISENISTVSVQMSKKPGTKDKHIQFEITVNQIFENE